MEVFRNHKTGSCSKYLFPKMHVPLFARIPDSEKCITVHCFKAFGGMVRGGLSGLSCSLAWLDTFAEHVNLELHRANG